MKMASSGRPKGYSGVFATVVVVVANTVTVTVTAGAGVDGQGGGALAWVIVWVTRVRG